MVEFKNKLFIYVLVGLQALNVLLSTYYLLTAGGLIFVITIIVSGGLLYLIYTKDEYLPLCTKVWAGIVTIGGAAGLVSSGCAYVHVASGGTELGPEYFTVGKVLRNLLVLAIGIYYLSMTSTYVVLKRKDDESQNMST